MNTDTNTDSTVVAVDHGDFKPPHLKKLPWWQALLVRVTRTYLQSFAGLTLVALVVPAQLPSPTGGNLYVLGPLLASMIIAAQYAIGPAIASLVQNAIELLTKLDQTAPELRA